MDENWKKKFGDAIQERKIKLRRLRISLIFTFSLVIISYITMSLSIQFRFFLGVSVSAIFFLSSPIILIFGILFSRRKNFVYGHDILLNNLYELTILMGNYQDPLKSQEDKNKSLKKIKKLLKESISMTKMYEEQGKRYVYPDDEKETLSFFSKNFYYFDYVIKNNQFSITDNVLNTIRDSCNKLMDLRAKNHINTVLTKNLGLFAWKSVNIPEQPEIKENRVFKFFTDRPNNVKFILYSSINTLLVGTFFYFIMPIFSNENLISNGITLWGVFEGAIFLIVLNKKSKSEI